MVLLLTYKEIIGATIDVFGDVASGSIIIITQTVPVTNATLKAMAKSRRQ